jgi:hypothetical protein
MTEAELITRAREYLADKVLDLADVPKMIALLVKVWDEYTEVQVKLLDQPNYPRCGNTNCSNHTCWCSNPHCDYCVT